MLVFSEVTFDGQAPDLLRIADKIKELSGLEMSVQKKDHDDQAKMYEIDARLAFAVAPEEQIELQVYCPGAARTFYDQTFQGVPQPMEKFVIGLNEPAGTQTVFLRSHALFEPTLLMATILALEALGGQARHPLPEELRLEYCKPLSLEEFGHRRRKRRKQNQLAFLFYLVMIPALIPVWLLAVVGGLVMMPYWIWKAYQISRDYDEPQISTAM